jgi:hypothetical protein
MGIALRCTLLSVVLFACAPVLRAQDRVLPPPATALKALEWMVGSWTHEAEGVVLKIECKRAEGGYFLERTFQIKLGRDGKLTLKQFIGWDPEAKRIQSWGFGSDGSVETATWTKNGSIWEARRSITYADGKKGTALNLTNVLDQDNFIFKSVDRHYGGQLLPDIMDVEVERNK